MERGDRVDSGGGRTYVLKFPERNPASVPALVLLFFLPWAAAASTAPVPIMSVDQVQRGMRGVGLTVFEGTQIDTFDAEILGVVRTGLGPGRDLILARLAGGPLARTGVARGMSGSPVYVDGQLIGAVAYGWAFSKAPICGITPIEQMLKVLDHPMQPPGGLRAAAPVGILPGTLNAMGIDLGTVAPAGRPVNMEPLGTPVWLAGVPPAASGALRELLRPLGLHVVSSPGGSSEIAPPPMEPGAALGVQLISGDMSVTSIGTATWVDQHRVVGFGHPMMMLGGTDLPLTGAFIYQIIPSQMFSFKLGSATRALGAMRQDRATAIAGVLGSAAAMVPVRVAVGTPSSRSNYEFKIAQHPELSAGLARAAVLGALESTSRIFGDATVEATSDIRLTDGQSLHTTQVYSGPTALLQAAMGAVAPVGIVQHSTLARLQPESIRIELRLQERRATAQIRSLRVGDGPVHPGQLLQVSISLQPYQLPVQHLLCSLRVPARIPPGTVNLRVGSAPAARGWDQEERPDTFVPRDAAHLLRLLSETYRNDELLVQLYCEGASLSLDGRELPGLPPSARAVLQATASAGRLEPTHGRIIAQARLGTEYVLTGEQSVELTVERSATTSMER
jgi:SpoIVB peptidase S55